MTVFITQEPIPNRKGWHPDLSSASQYGTIEYVLPSDLRASAHPDDAVELASEKLRNFNPDEDFICWALGDPTSLTIIISVLAGEYQHKRIRQLHWNRGKTTNDSGQPQGYYHPVIINI